MLKRIFSLLLFIHGCISLYAQNIGNYSFSASANSIAFAPLSSATTPSLTAGNADDGYFNNIPIGFDFYFMGIRYTTLSASTNGWILLGSAMNSSAPENSLATHAQRPILAPLWDDLSLPAASNFSYRLTGATGARVLTLEWRNARWAKSAAGAVLSFQVRINESTGIVQYIYRSESAAVNAGSASIGLAGSTTGTFQSANGFGTIVLITLLYIPPTSSSTTETTTISSKLTSNVLFTYTPPVPSAPIAVTFTNVTTNGFRIGWRDNATNEVGFAIYQSTDNVNFDYVGQTAANATSFDRNGLASGVTYYYRIYAISEGGLSDPLNGNIAPNCISAGTWTGRTSSAWNVASNWCGGQIPTVSTDVIIQSGALNFPVVSAGSTARNLEIQAGASLTVSGTLQVAGSINNSGTFDVSAGTLVMNGVGNQLIPANAFASATINNLTISNASGVSLGGTLRLLGTLTVNSGIFSTNGFLTLNSNSTATAQVASIPSSSAVTGVVNVERYLQGGPINPWRTYRMLSSPVYDNSTSFLPAGTRTYALTQFSDNMHITGERGTAGGFDASPQNAPSAFYYSSSGFAAFTNSTETTAVGSGVYLFYRGNRTNPTTKLYSPFADPENQVMNFVGVLNQQDVTVPLNYGIAANGQVGFNLVGNPYAATIDWNSSNLGKTNVGSTTWIWNPANRNYATFNGTTGVNGGSQYISSGQSFFVRALNNAASITFREGVKVPTQQPPVLLMSSPSVIKKTAAPDLSRSMVSNSNIPEIRIKMDNPQTYNTDETVVLMAEGGQGIFTDDDAIHLDGEGVFLATLSTDRVKLAINKMPELTSFKETALAVDASDNGDYTLSFLSMNLPEEAKLELVDRFLNQTFTVTQGYIHHFSIDKANGASFGDQRFLLKYMPPDTSYLENAMFNAVMDRNQVVISWDIGELKAGRHYYIESRKGNGVIDTIYTLKDGERSYRVVDHSPAIGINDYRLVEVGLNGAIHYSDWKSIKLSQETASTFIVAPNPAPNFFKITFSPLKTWGKYVVRITNIAGQKIKELVKTGELLNRDDIDVSYLPAGVYIVSLHHEHSPEQLFFTKLIKN